MINSPNVDHSKVTVISYWGAGFLNTFDLEIFTPVNWPFGPLPKSLAISSEDESDPKRPWRVIEIYGFPEGRFPKEYVRDIVAGGIYHFARQECLFGVSVKECGRSMDSCAILVECSNRGLSDRRSGLALPHTAIERTLDAILSEKFKGRSADVSEHFRHVAPMDIPVRKPQIRSELDSSRYSPHVVTYAYDIPVGFIRDPCRVNAIQSVGCEPYNTEGLVRIAQPAQGWPKGNPDYDPR